MNTSLKNSITGIINDFEPIHLDEMDRVRLMSRMDTKYVFSISKLPGILNEVVAAYLMLEIEGEREQDYKTIYFDTSGYNMYTSHHNGKLNRYKVRIREYASTGDKFFEVKLKNNKKKTIKKRIRFKEDNMDLSENQYLFIEEYTSFSNSKMAKSHKNSFTRLTLVNKKLSERITVDYNLRFEDPVSGKEARKENICIVEVKRDNGSEKSEFVKVLEKNKIRSMGFSKYFMGVAFTNSSVKKNRFKQKIQRVEKSLLKN